MKEENDGGNIMQRQIEALVATCGGVGRQPE